MYCRCNLTVDNFNGDQKKFNDYLEFIEDMS